MEHPHTPTDPSWRHRDMVIGILFAIAAGAVGTVEFAWTHRWFFLAVTVVGLVVWKVGG